MLENFFLKNFSTGVVCVYFVWYFIMQMVTFKRLQQNRLKVFIPFYNSYTLYKAVGMSGMYGFLPLLIALVYFPFMQNYLNFYVFFITGITVVMTAIRDCKIFYKAYNIRQAFFLGITTQFMPVISLTAAYLFGGKPYYPKSNSTNSKSAKVVSLFLAVTIGVTSLFSTTTYAIDENPGNANCSHKNVYYSFNQGLPCGALLQPKEDIIYKLCPDCGLVKEDRRVMRGDSHGVLTVQKEDGVYCVACNVKADLGVKSAYTEYNQQVKLLRMYVIQQNIPIYKNNKKVSSDKFGVNDKVKDPNKCKHAAKATFFEDHTTYLIRRVLCMSCGPIGSEILPPSSYDTVEKRIVLAQDKEAKQFFKKNNLSFEKPKEEHKEGNTYEFISNIKIKRKLIIENGDDVTENGIKRKISVDDPININEKGMCSSKCTRLYSIITVVDDKLAYLRGCFDCISENTLIIPEQDYDTVEERMDFANRSKIAKQYFIDHNLDYMTEEVINAEKEAKKAEDREAYIEFSNKIENTLETYDVHNNPVFFAAEVVAIGLVPYFGTVVDICEGLITGLLVAGDLLEKNPDMGVPTAVGLGICVGAFKSVSMNYLGEFLNFGLKKIVTSNAFKSFFAKPSGSLKSGRALNIIGEVAKHLQHKNVEEVTEEVADDGLQETVEAVTKRIDATDERATKKKLAEMTDGELIEEGKTDVSAADAVKAGRRTWRESEDFVGKLLYKLEGIKYDAQKSFYQGKYGDGINNRTKGSSRPDFIYLKKGRIAQVKNYKIETSGQRSRLVNNIKKQYAKDATNIPNFDEMTYTVYLDVYGQNYTKEIRHDIMERVKKAGLNIKVEFVGKDGLIQ